MKQLLAFFLCLLVHSPGFASYEATPYLAFETGYRRDRIDESLKVPDSTLAIGTGSNENQYNDISFWQVGAKGWWNVPCSNWVVKGRGHYGLVLNGNFTNDYVLKGNLQGDAVDALAGIGYQVPIQDCLIVVPLAGYSYDSQEFNVKNTISFNPAVYPLSFQQAKWKSRFYSPWIGVDLLFDVGHCAKINAGYEFHYGWANSRWEQKANPADAQSVIAYPYRTHFNNMRGHVFRFETVWEPLCHLHLGLNVQGTFWNNAHSQRSKIGSPASTGLTATQSQKVFRFSWRSFCIQLNAGYFF